MNDEDLPLPRRHWPTVLVIVCMAGVLVGAGVFVATRHDDGQATGATAGVTSTTIRPCVFLPDDAVTNGTVAPDGTYLARVSPGNGPENGSMYIDNSSAGFAYEEVPISPNVDVLGVSLTEWSPTDASGDDRIADALAYVAEHEASVTVEAGTIVAFDPKHRHWEMVDPPADDPCVAPSAGG